MELLRRWVKDERTQREALEERFRSCEDEWLIHDKMMYDIKQQLREIRQVCHDMKDAWDREVQELRMMQQLQPQAQQQPQQQLP